MPSSRAPLDGVEQRLLARGVAVGALQAPLLGPATVAVHDAADVGGDAPEVHALQQGHGGEATAGTRRRPGLPPGPRRASGRRHRLPWRRENRRRSAARYRRPDGRGGGCARSGRRRPPRWRRGPHGPARDGRGRRRAIEQRPPPGRAGRHRHGQDASPTSCRPSLAGQRVVVATATKALQDQLAGKDLPFVAEHLGVPFDVGGAQGPLQLPLPAAPATRRRRRRRPGRARARRPRALACAASSTAWPTWAADVADGRPGRARRGRSARVPGRR